MIWRSVACLLLVDRLLSELREYWKVDKPTEYPFPGKTDQVPLSGATIQRTCKMAAAQADIKKVAALQLP